MLTRLAHWRAHSPTTLLPKQHALRTQCKGSACTFYSNHHNSTSACKALAATQVVVQTVEVATTLHQHTARTQHKRNLCVCTHVLPATMAQLNKSNLRVTLDAASTAKHEAPKSHLRSSLKQARLRNIKWLAKSVALWSCLEQHC